MKKSIALLFLTLAAAQAQTGKYTEIPGLPPPPRYDVHPAKGTISVDGDLSDKAWANAKPITLMFPWDAQTGAKQKTTVRLLRDQTYLFVGYDCEDEDLTASYEKRDDPVYKDDCVEIFLKPDPTTDHYIGLEMNARGVLFDYFFNFPEKNDYSLNLEGVLLKTSLRGTLNQSGDKDQGWSLELAIPWRALQSLSNGQQPASDAQWRAQINRWDGTEPNRRLSMWTASGKKQPNPHNTERFGFLQFN